MQGGSITKDNVDEALNAEGMIIAVQTGTTGADYAAENFPNATVQGFGNSTDCFAAMQSGQANAVITNKAVVEKMLEAYTEAEIVKSVATGEEYAIVVAKDGRHQRGHRQAGGRRHHRRAEGQEPRLTRPDRPSSRRFRKDWREDSFFCPRRQAGRETRRP